MSAARVKALHENATRADKERFINLVKNYRLPICKACPEYNIENGTPTCKACGCTIEYKIGSVHNVCGLFKIHKAPLWMNETRVDEGKKLHASLNVPVTQNFIKTVWANKNEILDGVKNTMFKTEEVEQIARRRLIVCNTCEHKSHDKCAVPGTGPCCDLCGCSLKLKTRSISTDCPDSSPRWKAVIK